MTLLISPKFCRTEISHQKLVLSHLLSEKKLNYKEAHYEQFVKHTWNNIDEKRLKEQTKRNLAMIGERFNDNK